MPTERVRVLVLVKAAPVVTSALDETMCVAGARVDGDRPEWIRLHPVPFRDLASDSRFVKYQEVDVEVIRPRSDRRPESWTPLPGSIALGSKLQPKKAWADRRVVVSRLFEGQMCDLVEANRPNGSGPGVPSLAVVRPAASPALVIEPLDEDLLTKRLRRAEAATGVRSLFESSEEPKPTLEVMPWKFKYRYRCSHQRCRGHEQTIVDLEVNALWRNVRHRDNWRDLMRDKLEREMWEGRDSVLFVGNQEQHPISFLVLGVFWPPDVPYQPRLDQ